jgi:hypothetical protein
MKRITAVIALLSVIISINACKKDITLLPQSAATVGTFFKTSKDITSAIAGMYGSFLQEMTGTGTGNGNYFYWGEARSDNFNVGANTTFSVTEMLNNALTVNDAATDWGGLYRTIARANLNIANIPSVAQYDNSVTSTVTNIAMAQCYAMRAECYFYIIRNWGAAPIWTEPYLDPTVSAVRPRQTVQKIIDSVIIPDLTKAYAIMPKGQQATIWNINEGAICAILADVYMWRASAPVSATIGGPLGGPIGGLADYNNAITWYKNLFLAHGPTNVAYAGTSAANLESQATWKNVFLTPASSIEAIWSMNWDETVNGCACIPVSIQTSGNPLRVDPAIYVSWPKITADTRVAKTFDPTLALGAAAQGQYLLKYYNVPTQAILTAQNALVYNVYLVMYRLGDVYLSYAEALAQTNDLPDALKYLNYIHVRAGLPAYTATQFTTISAMEDAILQERQYELFGEGKRWYDLVRTNHVQTIMNPILIGRGVTTGFSDMNRVMWPISQTAINANNLLSQNASYY